MNVEENTENNDNANVLANDVGGEDQGSCSPAMPRGCVGCVVCRTQSSLALVRATCGFEVSSGRG